MNERLGVLDDDMVVVVVETVYLVKLNQIHYYFNNWILGTDSLFFS